MTLMRGLLFLVWLAVVGGLFNAGAFGLVGAVVAGLLGVALVVWPWARRRRSALRYIEMGKQPVGLL
jgi:hypothetical protein